MMTVHDRLLTRTTYFSLAYAKYLTNSLCILRATYEDAKLPPRPLRPLEVQAPMVWILLERAYATCAFSYVPFGRE